MLHELPRIGAFREASPTAPGDAGIAALAQVQGGMISVRQLRAAELSGRAVERRVSKGLLVDQGRGVYALGYVRRDDAARAWRAVLMYPRTALSHRSGAWGHGLRKELGRPIHLSSMTNRRDVNGITVHWVRALETDVQRGLPVTALARTFLDCAATLKPDELNAMLHRAEELRTFDLRPILPLLSGRRGSPALRAVLELHAAQLGYDHSELEQRFAQLIRTAGLPEPMWSVFVEDLWVDAFWPRQRVAVELDGGTHRTASAQDRDTRRNAILTAAGHIPLRYTWGQVTTDPAHVLRTLRAVL